MKKYNKRLAVLWGTLLCLTAVLTCSVTFEKPNVLILGASVISSLPTSGHIQISPVLPVKPVTTTPPPAVITTPGGTTVQVKPAPTNPTGTIITTPGGTVVQVPPKPKTGTMCKTKMQDGKKVYGCFQAAAGEYDPNEACTKDADCGMPGGSACEAVKGDNGVTEWQCVYGGQTSDSVGCLSDADCGNTHTTCVPNLGSSIIVNPSGTPPLCAKWANVCVQGGRGFGKDECADDSQCNPNQGQGMLCIVSMKLFNFFAAK